MISIIIWKDQENNILGFSSEGHAGYEDEGKDIICASVSTLFTTAVNAMEEQLGFKDHYMMSGDDRNFCEVWIPDHCSEEQRKTAEVILKTIVRGLKDVEDTVKKQYGTKYIRVTTRTK